MKLYIPVASGIEAAVKREVERMGFGHAPAIRGRLELTGDWETVARLNVFLRAGERVLIGVGEFTATTFDELFDGVLALPWEEYLTAHSKILIDGKSFQSRLAAVKAAGGVVKKAIITRLREKLRIATFDERGERAVVGVSIYSDVVTVTLDTSGDGLHKRGYRIHNYEAPLRETTAAAIVEDSFYHKQKALADPMCGSGTFPVEAVLYARNIAPGKNRPFDFAKWKCVPKGILDRVREQAIEGEYHGEIAPVYASDISGEAVNLAREHARRAGVSADIRFGVANARDFRSEEHYGVLVCNPPYGERIRSCDLEQTYRSLARAFRALPDWSAYVITSYDRMAEMFPKPTKRRILYNANIKCTLYTYHGKKPK